MGQGEEGGKAEEIKRILPTYSRPSLIHKGFVYHQLAIYFYPLYACHLLGLQKTFFSHILVGKKICKVGT